MHSSDLLSSKDWCDLIFENRNKDYGAYKLRSQAGMRYRRALYFIIGFFVVMCLAYIVFIFSLRYIMKRTIENTQDIFLHLSSSNLKEGYEVKFLATTRQAPGHRMAPGATEAIPKIVSGLPPLRAIGIDGPVVYDPEKEIIVTPIIDTTNVRDPSLPMAKQKIVPTDVVESMPVFPGGPKAFMQWIDNHIVYPQSAIRQGKTGLVHLSFIVGTDGYASEFEITNALDSQIYRSVLTALKSMPRWTPGLDAEGNPTPVKISLDVEFKI